MMTKFKCNYESVSELDIPIELLQPNGSHGGETVQGCFFVIHSQDGVKLGYFKFKRKWYSVGIVPNKPMTLVRIKGVRVKKVK